MNQCLSETLASLDDSTTSMKLTPMEKRILITKTIGDIHEKMCSSDAFEHVFHATGTGCHLIT
jgi:hypothetical protein